MAKRRWTIKDLYEMSDNRIIKIILRERIMSLNPYAPLARRVQTIIDNIDFDQEELPK
jgi:hypothetical protein